ncbi:MAG: ASCH domain-containing protein [DPANN group archaeon]|nr:ASCH domain-containing protein [DPANN group archaeon]
MKALSIRQPWVELILSCKKTIELRTWNTKFRGRFLIHASKTIDKQYAKQFNLDIKTFKIGAILGSAVLKDVIMYASADSFLDDKYRHLSEHFVKTPIYGFVLKNVQVFDKPIDQKGQLGFFNVKV